MNQQLHFEKASGYCYYARVLLPYLNLDDVSDDVSPHIVEYVLLGVVEYGSEDF